VPDASLAWIHTSIQRWTVEGCDPSFMGVCVGLLIRLQAMVLQPRFVDVHMPTIRQPLQKFSICLHLCPNASPQEVVAKLRENRPWRVGLGLVALHC